MQSMRLPRLALRTVTLATVLAVGSLAFVGVLPASASTLGGKATITNPSNGQPITSGGSNQSFILQLPAQAACSGDTQNHGYHIYTYLVPPASYSSSSLGPLAITNNQPTNGLGLLNTAGDYVGPINTDATTGQIDNSLVYAAGDLQFGQIISQGLTDLPTLLYSGGTPGGAGSSGIWETGILCATSAGVVSDFWNTEVTFTYSASDPNNFTWTAVAGLGTWVPESSLAIALPLAGLAIIGGGVVFTRRRRAARVPAGGTVTVDG